MSDTLGAHHSTVKLRPQLYPTPNNSPWTKRPSFELPQEHQAHILFRRTKVNLQHLTLINVMKWTNQRIQYITQTKMKSVSCNYNFYSNLLYLKKQITQQKIDGKVYSEIFTMGNSQIINLHNNTDINFNLKTYWCNIQAYKT